MSTSPRLPGTVRALVSRGRAALRRLRRPTRRWVERRTADEVVVSVVIPVKDAGADLSPLLVRLNEQRGFRRVQVVVVDSGSSDGSAETAEALGATVVRIAPEEFSHSYARNLGAERATGDYVLFTVQDALPPSDEWLREMFAALQRHGAAAVTCGEDPRADADLFYRVISWGHIGFMSVNGGDRLMSREQATDPLERRRNAQLSDTACLISRSLFLEYRHRGNYAEDLDLGLRLIDDRYRLAFLASPRIVHSHNRPAWYHLKRTYVEHLALLDMLKGYPTASGDGAAIARDMLRSCAAIDTVARDALKDLPPSCSPHQLREAVSAGLRVATSRPAVSVTGEPDYLDEKTRAFMSRLERRFEAAKESPDAAPGPLVHSVASIAEMISTYLEQAGPAPEQGLLDEFKAALYKGWALHCGVCLASVWWRSSEEARASLRAVHAELTSGV